MNTAYGHGYPRRRVRTAQTRNGYARVTRYSQHSAQSGEIRGTRLTWMHCADRVTWILATEREATL